MKTKNRTTVQISFKLSPEVRYALKTAAKRQGKTASHYVRELVRRDTRP